MEGGGGGGGGGGGVEGKNNLFVSFCFHTLFGLFHQFLYSFLFLWPYLLPFPRY